METHVGKAVEVRVRCSGGMHRILLTERGDLALPHHEDLEAERVLSALTGEKSRCLEILEAWRKGRIGLLPQGLKEARRATLELKLEREKRRVGRNDPLLVDSLKYRLPHRVKDLAESALMECTYRKAPDGHMVFVIVRSGARPHIKGSLQVRRRNKSWWEQGKEEKTSVVVVEIPYRWFRLWKRGLATALDPKGKRVFVLDLLQEEPLTVLVGRQKKGHTIHPQKARAVKVGGEWWLFWL